MRTLCKMFSLVRVTSVLLGILLMAIPNSARNLCFAAENPQGAAEQLAAGLIHSAQSGPWSAPATWDRGKVPGADARVQIREGHVVVYDVKSEQPIRLIHVAGTLSFASNKDTRLDVGLIKIQAGDARAKTGSTAKLICRTCRPAGHGRRWRLGRPIGRLRRITRRSFG